MKHLARFNAGVPLSTWTILIGLVLFPVRITSSAAEQAYSITVTNPLALARKGEVIELDWARLKTQLTGIQAEAVYVLADGVVLATQVVDENADEQCDKLLFQADFAPHQTRRFQISATSSGLARFKPRTHAIFSKQPGLDYVAWENDRIAFRLYGPLCEFRLVSSGLDVWAKRVDRLILDAMSKRNYHLDNGEGADCYTTGEGRGCGGLGIWKDGRLCVSRNYRSWKILAEGPVRVMVELTYEPWDAGGIKVSEVKRISLDAGSQLSHIESILSFAGADHVEAAVGLGIPKGATVTLQSNQLWAAVWQGTDGKDNGMLGLGLAAPPTEQSRVIQAADHALLLAPVSSGKPLVYYAGAGWSKFGYADAAAWNACMEAFARRLAAPLQISW